jgi:hypothetical protein
MIILLKMKSLLILLLIVIGCTCFIMDSDCVCVYANETYSCGAMRGDQWCCLGQWYVCNWDWQSGCYRCPPVQNCKTPICSKMK